MNDLQKQKALEKLGEEDLSYYRLPMLDTSSEQYKKEKAFKCHVWACKMIEAFNLPYRVLYDYFMEYGTEYLKGYISANNGKICLLNRCYPLPGYEKSKLIGVSCHADYIGIQSGPFKDDLTSSNYDLRFSITDESINAEIEAKAAEQHQWDLSTQEGFEKWKYFFAHFLGKADLSNYSCLDLFGKKEATSADNKRLDCWKSLQADYHFNPDNYMKEEPPYLPEYEDKYTLWKFYWNDMNLNDKDLQL